MARRTVGLMLMVGLRLLMAPLPAEAQPAGRSGDRLPGREPASAADRCLRSGPSGAGLRRGSNLVLDLKLAHGRVERLPDLAVELVQFKPDVIVAAANVGGLAAKQATSTIPIVVVASHDGVQVGLFASLARPEGNLTGVESLAPDLDMQRLEFLKQAVPGCRTLRSSTTRPILGAPATSTSYRPRRKHSGVTSAW